MDGFDPVTGELPPEETIVQHALRAARAERQDRRDAAKGVGLVSIYGKLARAYAQIPAVLRQDGEAKALVDTKSGGKAEVKNQYTKYPTVVKIIRPLLLAEGIIIRHRTDRIFQMGDGQHKTTWLPVITDLIDTESGEVVSCELPMPIVRNDPRAVGSALSFGKRYTLLGAVAVATGDVDEDDDAVSAMPRELHTEGDVDALIRECRENETEAEANNWRKAVRKRLDDLEPEDFEAVKQAFQAHVKGLRNAAENAAAAPLAPKPEPKAKATTARNRIAPTHNDGCNA